MANIPPLNEQTFTETALRGFVFTPIENRMNDPGITFLNKFLEGRVDSFWEKVVIPLRQTNDFDPNKIKWYFEIYKEGLEAHTCRKNPFTFVEITQEQIEEIVEFYNNKTLKEYLNLGMTFISNTFTILSSWYRDQLVQHRLETIYNSQEPVNWIKTAEQEETGAMQKEIETVPGLKQVLENISMLMSRRI